MSKETGVAVLGIGIALLPFLGFPESWRVVFFVLGGFGLAALGFLLRADHLHREDVHGSHASRPRNVGDESFARDRTMAEGTKKMSDIAAPQPISEAPSSE